MEFRTYSDREMLAMGLADALAASLRSCLAMHDHASFCVPGGSSPGEVFSLLSGSSLDWSRVHVFLNDERWVPEDDPRSNTALVKRTLLTDRAAAATWVPMHADTRTPEDAIPDLAPALAPELPISLLLLGMGEDMHTASLFPGGDRLAEAMADDAPVLMGMRADLDGPPRITLTAPVLRDAMETHILIMGEAKKAAIEAARGQDPLDAPIAAFLRGATIHWAP